MWTTSYRTTWNYAKTSVRYMQNMVRQQSFDLTKYSFLTSFFFCFSCRFKSRHTLHTHMKRTHMSKPMSIACSECGKITPNANALRSHMQYSHNANIRLHECKICDRSFKKSTHLKVMLTRQSSRSFWHKTQILSNLSHSHLFFSLSVEILLLTQS